MIYGERIRLRAIERTDIPRFVAWLNDPEVCKYLLMRLPMSQAQEERWFEANLMRPMEEQVLSIEAQVGEEWQPIGNTSFMNVNWIVRSAEVGIMIGEKAFWNQGYGREAMRLMLKHGFETLNLNRIYLTVFAENVRAIKAYEHAGYQLEGRMRQSEFKEGKYADMLLMSALREDWPTPEK
jgi:diamine N-acetyltransferase